MNRYVKKPIAIEAVKWKGFNNDEIKDFAGDNVKIEVIREGDADNGIPPSVNCSIETLEGVMTANVGDYIIKGVNGEFYPCKSDIFEKTYVKEPDTFLDRLYIEDSDLTEKYEKCSAFVDSDKFRETIKEDYPAFLLYLQREAMGSYLGTLHNRIEYANGSKTKPDTKYGFGEAIIALKFGLAIRRDGWNGKGLMVFKQVPTHIEGDIIPKMQSLPQSAKDLILEGNGFIDYTSQCLIYNENTGRADSWVPSISDVFAEDWEIVR